MLSPLDATLPGTVPYHGIVRGASTALKNACEELLFWALPRSSDCSGRGGYFSHYDARSGRVRDEARSFSFLRFRQRLRFVSSERASERANEGLVVGRCRCSVHSPWCCVGSARGPAARPPRLLVAWPEDGNGGWRTRRETGDGNGQCCCRGVAHHQEGHESADHRLTKRVCLARPLPVCLESVLKKRTVAACLAATTTRFRPARGGRGVPARQTGQGRR